ncbi:MAG: hypothetical protein KKA07_06130 [Bacteroidetes bacterium]|nr:hypothetical protein [Bacteroidota bacterium]MBU1718632.1 hypothetical protein [Bacteroidota bacterium]
MFRLILSIGVYFLLNLNVLAQRSEFGFMAGGSYYIGDLNPKAHFLQTQPAAGILYRYNFNPRFAFKSNFYLGMIYGDDARSKFNIQRNLSFRSMVGEFSGEFEFNFLPYIAGNPKFPYSPYVFAGLSIIKFNPQANFHGAWYNLQPLGTEGQGTTAYSVPPYNRKPYSLTTAAIPFGIGAKLTIAKRTCLAIEYGLRKTYTDYLDDVSTTYPDPLLLKEEKGAVAAILSDRTISTDGDIIDRTGFQRGNSKNNDWVAFAVITLTVRLNSNAKELCPAYGAKKPKYSFKEYNMH